MIGLLVSHNQVIYNIFSQDCVGGMETNSIHSQNSKKKDKYPQLRVGIYCNMLLKDNIVAHLGMQTALRVISVCYLNQLTTTFLAFCQSFLSWDFKEVNMKQHWFNIDEMLCTVLKCCQPTGIVDFNDFTIMWPVVYH